MSFSAALASASLPSADPDALADLAREALAAGEEERALPLIEAGLAKCPTARLWQWKGLLERALDRHDSAMSALDEAARLDPDDASIAHGRARIALEAGLPAEGLYERALALDPVNGELLTGRAAARFAAGHGDQAQRELEAALRRAPLWIEGHMHLAQLRSMLGLQNEIRASLEEALSTMPRHTELWRALLELAVKREDFEGLTTAAESAKSIAGAGGWLLPYEAIAAAELGKTDRADNLFDELERSRGPQLPIWRIRHLLRTQRADEAVRLIDAELTSGRAADTWPYASLAWRLIGDPRSRWLDGDERIVWEADIAGELPPLDRLAELLRSLHVAKSEYLDQSVRGGTQTDGPLLSRVEPEIRSLRTAIVGAIERYLAQLPAGETKHPLLGPRRDRRIRFAGSWSVRLAGEGFHASHVHPLGWISSALYVALPESISGGGHSGWLTLGEPPPNLPLGLDAVRRIEPTPGKLVLFPSWIWHGTVPFASGERLTVAFDVAVPR